jgi:hypothetical protein
MSKNRKLIKNVLNKLLSEAPIDYGDSPERMDPGHAETLAQKQTPFSQHPAMPDVNPEGVPSDFPELMASKRFKDVVEDVKRFTGLRNIPVGNNGIAALQRILMTAVYRILDLEDGNREALAQLAVELVKQEFGVHDDDYQWDVKILDIRNPEQGGEMKDKIQQMNNKPQEEQEDAIEEAIDTLNDIELEKYKRRFMNAIVQGSAQKMNQAYYLVQERLNAIHPDLLNLYGTMMAANDLQYWILPDEVIQMMAGGGSGAGTEEVNNETDPPTIKARGINFPTLVHEITKAVMDAIATHGLPDDETTARAVIDSEDTLAKEAWDLRLGPVIWEKFRAAYPQKLFADDQRRIQAYLIAEFAKLPADEFMSLAKQILSGSDRGKRRVEQIVDGILESLRDEEYAEFEYNRDTQNKVPDEEDLDNISFGGGFDPSDPSTW